LASAGICVFSSCNRHVRVRYFGVRPPIFRRAKSPVPDAIFPRQDSLSFATWLDTHALERIYSACGDSCSWRFCYFNQQKSCALGRGYGLVPSLSAGCELRHPGWPALNDGGAELSRTAARRILVLMRFSTLPSALSRPIGRGVLLSDPRKPKSPSVSTRVPCCNKGIEKK
jgi:hypothetical protein